MIVSKASLQVIGVTNKDSQIPVLDNIHITKEGTTVGSSRGIVLAVSPVNEEVKKKLHLKETPLRDGVTLNSAFTKKIIKNIPPDKHFKGLLEHADIENSVGGRIDANLHDGEQEFSINGRKYPDEYIPHKEILGNALNARNGVKFIVNRVRLKLLLDAIEKTCPDSSGESPIFFEFCDNHTILMRCVNLKTGQRILAAVLTMQFDENKWLKDKSWERSLLDGNISKDHINCKPRYYTRGTGLRDNKLQPRLYKKRKGGV